MFFHSEYHGANKFKIFPLASRAAFTKEHARVYNPLYMENTSIQRPWLAKIVLFLLGAAVFVPPLLVIPHTFFIFINSKTSFFIGIAELAFFCYIFLALFYPAYRPKKNIVTWGFLGFVAVSVLSAIVSVYPQFSFWSGAERADGVMLLIHIFLFFLVCTSVIKSKKELHTLLWVSVFTATINTLAIWLGPGGFKAYLSLFHSDQNIGGFTGNELFAGAYTLFNVFFAAYLFFDSKKKGSRMLSGILFLLMLFSPIFFNFGILSGAVNLKEILHNPIVLIGRARASTIGLGLAGIFTFFLFFGNHAKKAIRFGSRALAGATLAAIMISIILLMTPGTRLHDWFGKETAGYRYIYWHQAIQGWKDHPILGWGPGTFRMVTAKYFDPAVLATVSQNQIIGEPWNDKPHSIILDVLVHTGILGLISYAGIFFTCLFALWRKTSLPHYAKSLFSGLLLAYVLKGLTIFDVMVSYLMLGTALAVIAIITAKEETGKEQGKIFQLSKKAKNGIAIALFIIGFFSIRYFAYEPLHEARQRFVLPDLPPAERAGKYKIVRDISPFGGSVDEANYADLVYISYLEHLDSIANQKDQLQFIRDMDGLIADVEESFGKNGMTYVGALTVSRLYNLRYMLAATDDQNLLSEMEKYAKITLDLSPNNPQSYWAEAQPLIYERKYKEAMEVLEKGLAINPKVAPTHEIIIRLALLMGDRQLVLEKYKRAQKELPGIAFPH